MYIFLFALSQPPGGGGILAFIGYGVKKEGKGKRAKGKEKGREKGEEGRKKGEEGRKKGKSAKRNLTVQKCFYKNLRRP